MMGIILTTQSPFFLKDTLIKATPLYICKKILLNLYFWPVFLLTTLILLVLIPPVAHLVAVVKRQPVAHFFRRGISLYGFIVVRCIPFMAPTILIDKSGTHDKPVIYVANHLSSIDPYCFGIVDTTAAMLTSWPFNIPFFRLMMTSAEYIDTRKGWESIQEQAHILLNKKCNILIWPEGHRSRDGQMAEFQRSAFRLAVEAGCQIVPVCFVGTNKVMAPGQHLLSPHRPKVILLPPLKANSEDKPRRAIKKLCQETYQAIADELKHQQKTP